MIGMCVLHIKPVFLPVDIQHKQCPCRFFNPVNREIPVQVMWPLNYATEILHCYAVNRVDNAMPCHQTGSARHTHSMKERKEKKRKKTKEKIGKKRKNCRAPP